jgi:hypothetical protein
MHRKKVEGGAGGRRSVARSGWRSARRAGPPDEIHPSNTSGAMFWPSSGEGLSTSAMPRVSAAGGREDVARATSSTTFENLWRSWSTDAARAGLVFLPGGSAEP